MGEVAVAEEQPGAARRFRGAALLHEGAERCHSGAGADHDDVGGRVRRQAEMLVGLHPNPQLGAVLDPVGHVHGGDAGAGATVGLVAHGGDGEMHLIAHFLAGGRDGIGPRRQRPGDRGEMIRGQRRGKPLQQVDQVAALDPGLHLAAVHEGLGVGMPGGLGEPLDRGGRQRGDVALGEQRLAQGLVAGKPGGLQDLLDQLRIVLGEDLERVARLVGRRPILEFQGEVDRLLVGARGIEVHVVDHLDHHRLAAEFRFFVLAARGPEIDGDDIARRSFGRGERLQRALDQIGGGLLEIEIEIGTVIGPLGTERLEACVQCLADGAELRVARVTERQHAELDAVEARCAVPHQLAIGPDRAGRRLAFAPGRRDGDELADLRQRGEIELGEIDHLRLEALLARELAHVAGKLLRVAGFGREQDGERLGRLGRRGGRRSGRGGGLTRSRVQTREKAREPCPLDRRRSPERRIEMSPLLIAEGGGAGE